MHFEVKAPYKPTGDQPEAIRDLVEGIQRGEKAQTVLGVTGSGKTFTIANVIAEVRKPTLVISHNKTLAAQLYGEFKQFFPQNAVEYFVSYYDYYQPEAYIPATGVYIEKDIAVNEQIKQMRLSTISTLVSGRRDVVVVASVSCIYGLLDPSDLKKSVLWYRIGDSIKQKDFLLSLVNSEYSHYNKVFGRGNFRSQKDTVDVFLPYEDYAYRFKFSGDEIATIHRIKPATSKELEPLHEAVIFPANLFITSKETLERVIAQVQVDLAARVEYYTAAERYEEAKRIKMRTEMDIEMMREVGYCSGIENYSRYFDGRAAGERPFCLLDYFPKDYLLVIDESHVTLPQLRGGGGDRARKMHLVDHGFRLPAALDNRPLDFAEFESLVNQIVFVSATPAAYELQQSEGVVVEQIIRPTGLLDPEIALRPTKYQIDDLLKEISACRAKQQRVLVVTLTKYMAEELTKYLQQAEINCCYIHSDVKTLERVAILRDLRQGKFEVLVGVNLLREGLDLPEVALVVIFDADKSGFLRNATSLIQTIGRAARNIQGRVIMYADNVTPAMQQAIDETRRRRATQVAYNNKHGIVPKPLTAREQIPLQQQEESVGQIRRYVADRRPRFQAVAAPEVVYKTAANADLYQKIYKRMKKAAKTLNFVEAARLRDELAALGSKKPAKKH